MHVSRGVSASDLQYCFEQRASTAGLQSKGSAAGRSTLNEMILYHFVECPVLLVFSVWCLLNRVMWNLTCVVLFKRIFTTEMNKLS